MSYTSLLLQKNSGTGRSVQTGPKVCRGIGQSPSELWSSSSSSYSSSLCQMKQATSPENDLSKPNQQRFLGMTTMFAGCDVNSDLDKRMNVVTKATSAGLDTLPHLPQSPCQQDSLLSWRRMAGWKKNEESVHLLSSCGDVSFREEEEKE